MFGLFKKKTQRQNCNEELLKIISRVVKDEPDMKFGHILARLSIVETSVIGNTFVWKNECSVESGVTLHRVYNNKLFNDLIR